MRADGTGAAPAALAAADLLGDIWAVGYNGSAYVRGAIWRTIVKEAWTATANGTSAQIVVTPLGTASSSISEFHANGSLLIPSTVVGGDTGPGTINVSAGYYIGGVNVTPGQSAAAQTATANPAGTTQTTARMMGLGGAIAAKFTGRIWLTMTGDVFNAAAGDGATIQLSYGAGAAPANGAALTGTQIGARINYIAGAATEKVPFSLTALVTGLVANTAYWLDAAVAAIGGGTATIENVVISAREF